MLYGKNWILPVFTTVFVVFTTFAHGEETAAPSPGSSGGSLVQRSYLKAANACAGDRFGSGISLSDERIIVSAIDEDSKTRKVINGHAASDDDSAKSAGAAYVFYLENNLWSPEAYIKAPNTDPFDYFGTSVDIAGDTIVVGANGEDSKQNKITNGPKASRDNSAKNAGAVYVFKLIKDKWKQEAYLKASNAGSSDGFGFSTAISGNTIVVGAWLEDSSQTTVSHGAVASDDDSAKDAGAAYVFRHNGKEWIQEAYLKAPNAGAGDRFGHSVEIYGDTIVVGAPKEDGGQKTIINGPMASDDDNAGDSGAAYIFRRTNNIWKFEAYLKAPNADAADNFGNAVTVFKDTVVVGAFRENSGQTTVTNGGGASGNNNAANSGAAYVFRRSDGKWITEAYLKPSNAEEGDNFGTSMAALDDMVIIGSSNEDSDQANIRPGAGNGDDNKLIDSGAAYVFVRTGNLWAQTAFLKPPNPDSGDLYGTSVAVSGKFIAVGAKGESSKIKKINNNGTASSNNRAGNAGAGYLIAR